MVSFAGTTAFSLTTVSVNHMVAKARHARPAVANQVFFAMKILTSVIQ
jgi:hypothetical protein